MLNKIEVTNSRGNVFTLFMEENDGGYQIDEIEGLDPVKATLSSTSYAGTDGEIFQSAKLPARNIKISIRKLIQTCEKIYIRSSCRNLRSQCDVTYLLVYIWTLSE
jgi:hypothetical protein